MIPRALFLACAAAFASLAVAQTLQAPAPVKRSAVTVPSLPEIVCRTTIHSSALECKPSGQYACPVEVLYQRGARTPVQVCPATCAPQSMSGASCDCTFIEAQCRDRPRGR